MAGVAGELSPRATPAIVGAGTRSGLRVPFRDSGRPGTAPPVGSDNVLTPEQRRRSDQNRARALEILAIREVLESEAAAAAGAAALGATGPGRVHRGPLPFGGAPAPPTPPARDLFAVRIRAQNPAVAAALAELPFEHQYAAELLASRAAVPVQRTVPPGPAAAAAGSGRRPSARSWAALSAEQVRAMAAGQPAARFAAALAAALDVQSTSPHSAGRGADGAVGAYPGLRSRSDDDSLQPTTPMGFVDAPAEAPGDAAFARYTGLVQADGSLQLLGPHVRRRAADAARPAGRSRRWRREAAEGAAGGPGAEEAGLRVSCRAFRRWGSDRFLRLEIHRDAPRSAVEALCRGPLRIAGRLWEHLYYQPMAATLTFVAVEGSGLTEPPLRPRLTPEAFREWAVPTSLCEANRALPACKYLSRHDLSFSGTLATVHVPRSATLQIPDLHSPAGNIMTDGCGLMHAELAYAVTAALGLTAGLPTFFQARYGGTKGLFLVIRTPHEWPHGPDCRLAYRSSQLKFHLPAPDSHQLMFEVVAYPKPRDRASPLWAQLLPLIECRLDEDAGSMAGSMVARTGRAASSSSGASAPMPSGADVLMALFEEAVTQEARALLLAPAAPDGAAGPAPAPAEVAALREELSRDPDDSCAGEVRAHLDAGFSPAFPRVRRLLTKLLKARVERFREGKIPLALSARLAMVPDPFGVLGRGEIYAHSACCRGGALKGPVLLARAPAHFPSDLVRATAVAHPRLLQFTEVCVINTADAVSMAELMAGGDYDGDEALVVWEPRIACRLAPGSGSVAPPGACRPARPQLPIGADPAAASRAAVRYTLDNLGTLRTVGILAKAHELLAASAGARDPDCLALARLNREAVDAAKYGSDALRIPAAIDARVWHLRDEKNRAEAEAAAAVRVGGRRKRPATAAGAAGAGPGPPAGPGAIRVPTAMQRLHAAVAAAVASYDEQVLNTVLDRDVEALLAPAGTSPAVLAAGEALVGGYSAAMHAAIDGGTPGAADAVRAQQRLKFRAEAARLSTVASGGGAGSPGAAGPDFSLLLARACYSAAQCRSLEKGRRSDAAWQLCFQQLLAVHAEAVSLAGARLRPKA